ncbi:MAG: PEP-CTERM sorting domain-containing protein [Phycisphaerales bacterium]|nr:PEP-CTERM sorting domain-containing protein [Phycisphaerales bacterium]
MVRGTNATRTLIYRQGQFVPEGNGMFDDAGFGIVNDAGQVAFQFELADGRMGVAVTAIPAPGAMVLMGLGTLAVIRRRR